MKTNLKVLFFTILFLGFNTINAQTFEWAKSFGEINNDIGYSIAVDALGNVYTTGFFQGTVDFDPGTGISNLTSSGDEGIFVQKLDANGNFQWAKSLGGSSFSDNIGYSIALDTSNNVYITGEFNGNVFVQKMDTNGNILWEIFLESSLICIGFSIVVDTSGNVYTTGYFQGTVDFDPGTGISNLTAFGTRGIFVQKLDTNGNFLWAKSFGGNGYSEGKSIALDISGNVYTTGYFRGSGDFDPGSGISILTGGNGYDDVFVQKMDANGNFLWAKSLAGDDHEGGSSIITDASGNVYTTGYFEGIVDFDSGTSISNLTASGSRDVFVQKMDANGNFIWAKSFGGANLDGSTSIVIGASGDLYLIGYFYGTVDFDPGTGINNLTSEGAGDVFVQKMDTNGNSIWAKSFGGSNSDSGISIAVDTSENIYTVGGFNGTVDFDPDLGTNDLISLGNYDVFVQKMSQSNLGVQEISNKIKVIAYPNPSEGIININFSRIVNNVQFIITDVLGKIIKIQTYSSIINKNLELPNTKGIYFLTIKTQNSQQIIKIVKK
ncbi:hypothetical protein FORMB_22670 [Formosa sp. Hel1_33_131]|uniref:SBBP repeat-containing protein n=1 Tax=Formosa sp. Hel1_33_131 TaxID=1336794 RepID=UPI00084E142E|nr:SBBP repeat-containing protein [Formosa sp. Hel1_33_131]AOR29285.1 hypothetical protein FORMB_22670 [Formosa sp. Hel1_33_131]